MMEQQTQETDYSEFVEFDPTGRYGRYNEILGKGASKTVYKAFDEYEGIEVAWNQVKLYDFLQSPEELERLYCEIHLLKTLKHKNIMKFYTSWVDTSNRKINFVTEMFTSGTLRQYRQKHKRVNIRAVKLWCRQILKGLIYLHSHNPPVIHRDLKCDNIFINGNQGEVKIGDLGLAAILRKSHADNCVGTPEFMAPEIYEEQYNELVDIYSFGMCILEMVTFEYPYSECTHAAQIYKKVSNGMKPESLYKVQDPEVRKFVEKCLATASRRLPAKELLRDPFLQIDGSSLCSREDDTSDLGPLARQPSLSPTTSNDHLIADWFSSDPLSEIENEWECDAVETEPNEIELFGSPEDEMSPYLNITIKGRKREEDGAIFLRLRIADKEGRIRNIYFSFDIEADTALSVATEMVGELDIIDYDVISIADMIDDEISSLVPDWKPGPGFVETPGVQTPGICPNCESYDSPCTSLGDFLSSNNSGIKNLPASNCHRIGCSAATHGRFEEVTYQVDGSERLTVDKASKLSSQTDGLNMCSPVRKVTVSDVENERLNSFPSDARKSFVHRRSKSSSRRTISQLFPDLSLKDALENERKNSFSSDARRYFAHSRSKSSSRRTISQVLSGSTLNDQSLDILEEGYQYHPPDLPDIYENEIRHELRWLKAKYETELQDYQNQQSEERKRPPSPYHENEEYQVECGIPGSLILPPLHASNKGYIKSLQSGWRLSSYLSRDDTEPTTSSANTVPDLDNSLYRGGHFNAVSERIGNCESNMKKASQQNSFIANNCYTGSLLPGCVPRVKSLSVDAADT